MGVEPEVTTERPTSSSPHYRAAGDRSNEMNHISVCICTYKRPQFLSRLLKEIADQETSCLFTYSIVVCDNDRLESAKSVVSEFAAVSAIPVGYCVEPRQNISLARNKAIENAEGDLIAFIDDDEFPAKLWLLTLFKACYEHNVDGVLGPVKRYFDEVPPKWLLKSNFYERPTYPTGLVIDYRKGRTGNALLKRRILEGCPQPFRPEVLVGSDQDFFRRMIENGYVFIWCNEAIAYEIVPPIRWKRSFMLRRALLRGQSNLTRSTTGTVKITKSLVAVSVYTLALPFSLILGQHRFMTLLVKIFDHLGKLLARVGINPITDPYVTD